VQRCKFLESTTYGCYGKPKYLDQIYVWYSRAFFRGWWLTGSINHLVIRISVIFPEYTGTMPLRNADSHVILDLTTWCCNTEGLCRLYLAEWGSNVTSTRRYPRTISQSVLPGQYESPPWEPSTLVQSCWAGPSQTSIPGLKRTLTIHTHTHTHTHTHEVTRFCCCHHFIP
jgi:hypothetical protein